ncbi:MAG TPA: hypothetical protein VGP47_02980, partial [Parachlamydiaceae bacterium]|nr:hypothetical protein [Parachlamydiaceae bacterium]
MNLQEGFSLILDNFPTFEPLWKNHLNNWSDDPRGATNDFHILIDFIYNDLLPNQKMADVVIVAELIEFFLEFGDEELSYGASMGFLEGLTNKAGNYGETSIIPFIDAAGPKSLEFMDELDKFWGTNTIFNVFDKLLSSNTTHLLLNNAPRAHAFSNDSQKLFVGDALGTIYVFDLPSSSLELKIKGDGLPILAMACDANLLYTFNAAGGMNRYTHSLKVISEGKIILRDRGKWNGRVEKESFDHALFTPDKKSLIIITQLLGLFMPMSQLHKIDLADLSDFGQLHLERRFEMHLPDADADTWADAIAISKDGRYLAVTACTSTGTMDGDWAYGCPEFILLYDLQ